MQKFKMVATGVSAAAAVLSLGACSSNSTASNTTASTTTASETPGSSDVPAAPSGATTLDCAKIPLPALASGSGIKDLKLGTQTSPTACFYDRPMSSDGVVTLNVAIATSPMSNKPISYDEAVAGLGATGKVIPVPGVDKAQVVTGSKNVSLGVIQLKDGTVLSVSGGSSTAADGGHAMVEGTLKALAGLSL